MVLSAGVLNRTTSLSCLFLVCNLFFNYFFLFLLSSRTQCTKDGSESEEDDGIEALIEESALFVANDEITKSNCQTKLDACARKQIVRCSFIEFLG